MDLPTLPPWEGAHPIVVHFPIALLLVAPVLVLLSLLVPKLRQGIALAALAVMALGAAGATLAVATGEAAEDYAIGTPAGKAADDLIEEHSDSAETSRTLFLVLTAGYGAMLVVPAVRKKAFPRGADLALHGVFLAFYAVGCLQLAHTGELGGRLVHEKGVRAKLAPAPGESHAPAEDGGRRGRGGR